MTPTSLDVFALENTGKGDLQEMELSGLREYKKMFKRSFSVNIQEHPEDIKEIFDKEMESQDAAEKREMYIEDDGTVNIIKTWYWENS